MEGMVERIHSHEDEMRGIARYRLDDGRQIQFDARAIREYGLAVLMEAAGLELTSDRKRLPVIRNGRLVGSLPADFDPLFIRSTSFLYDPRPGDFRRQGDHWVADRMLGMGDLMAVPGFVPEE